MSSPAKSFVTKALDKSGAETELVWTPRIRITVLRRVKEELGLDLIDDPALFDPQKQADSPLAKLSGDTIKMVGVLWLSIEKQADDRGIGPDEFADLIFGDVFTEAFDAWMEAYINFFQNPRRAILEKGYAASRVVTKKTTDLATKACEPGGAIDRAIEKAIAEMFPSGSESKRSPDTSAAIPSP